MAENILETILVQKRHEIAAAKGMVSVDELKKRASSLPDALGFAEKLRTASAPAIIAEIKRASPSKGIIRADLDPLTCAREFSAAGAACLSVLTDEQFFGGKLEFIAQIKSGGVSIPILRKDFICDPYQVWETRVAGADALLLIVAALTPSELDFLMRETIEARLDMLIEVHNADELTIALDAINRLFASAEKPAGLSYPLLGINNRDLRTFVTDLDVTQKLINWTRSLSSSLKLGLDSLLIVSESGIFAADDLKTLDSFGAQAFLIGESLVKSGSPGENLRMLIEEYRA